MPIRGPMALTADDIWTTPDDGQRHEVIDGALYVTAVPAPDHQLASGNLFALLWQHITPRRLYAAPIGVKLDPANGVEPDLVFLAADRLGLVTPRGIEGAPDLVVEVLSPGTAAVDRGVKLRRYAAAGVPHYWLTDPAPRPSKRSG